MFRASDAWAYVGVAVTCTAGSIIGSRLRGNFNTEHILRGLYVVLILSTSTMFENVLTSGAALGWYCGTLLVFGGALASVVVWRRRRQRQQHAACDSSHDVPDSASHLGGASFARLV